MPLFLALTDSNTPSPLLVAILFTAVTLPVGVLIGYLSAYRFKRQYMQVARELANFRGQNFRGELTTLGGIARGGQPPARLPPMPHGLPANAEAGDAASAVELDPNVEAGWREKFDATAQQLVALQNDYGTLQGTHATTLEELQRAEASIDVLNGHIEDLEKQLDAAETRVGAAEAARDEALAVAESARVAAQDAPAAAPAAESSTGTEAWQLAQLHREQIMMQLQLDEHVETVNQLNHALRLANADLDDLRSELAEKVELVGQLQDECDDLRSQRNA